MKKYRGFYIDGITFKNRAEIDNFIKLKSLKAFKAAVKRFDRDPSAENSIWCMERAEYLNKECGMTWTEIEELEIAVYTGA